MSLCFDRNHPLVINRDKHTIEIWDSDKLQYEPHTQEFIEDLADIVKNTHESTEGITVINTYVRS